MEFSAFSDDSLYFVMTGIYRSPKLFVFFLKLNGKVYLLMSTLLEKSKYLNDMMLRRKNTIEIKAKRRVSVHFFRLYPVKI